LQLTVADARNLANQAEQAWVKDDYDTANKYIGEAYELLDRIPPPPPVINSWLIAGIIISVVIVAILISLAMRRRAS
jgi:hypothetical protein